MTATVVRRLPSTFLALALGALLMLLLVQLGVAIASAEPAPLVADIGVFDAAVAPVDAGPYRDLYVPARTVVEYRAVDPNDPGDLISEAYRGVTGGDWFLAAGALLSLVVLAVRWLLAKRWPNFATDTGGVVLTAALAGCGALGHAWLADAELATATTLVGAVKVWAAAVFTYVTTRKLLVARPVPRAKAGAVALLIALAGCPGPGPVPVVADAVIDCTSANRPKIDALLGELAPLVFLQAPDWSSVYQRAKQAGRDVGGCVIAELVQRYLGGRRAVPENQSWQAHETLERFRAEEAGGASFKTAHGNL